MTDFMPENSNNIPINSSENTTKDRLFKVEEFCEKHGGKSKGILITYAPEVYVIAKFGGVERAREYFSEKLGRKISKHPIEELLHKIRTGKVVITEKEIWAEAKRHPDTAEFFIRTPSAMDPKDDDDAREDHHENQGAGQVYSDAASAATASTRSTEFHEETDQSVGGSTLVTPRIDGLRARFESDKQKLTKK
jgi:hypothetical protein